MGNPGQGPGQRERRTIVPVDAVSIAPDQYKVLVENDRVRVLEARYRAGVKSRMHSHPDMVAVALTPAKVKFTLANRQTAEVELRAGETMFAPGQDHTAENTGTSEFRVILVELK